MVEKLMQSFERIYAEFLSGKINKDETLLTNSLSYSIIESW
jgi:hypothetical protein